MENEPETEMDSAFLERDACRRAGKPVKIMETERLQIRETIMEDVEVLYRIGQCAGPGGLLRPLQPTLKEEIEFMEAYIHHSYAFFDFGLWTVLERQSGHIIGRAGLFPTEVLEEGVELGYLIAPEYRRKGLATECGRAIIAYASQVLDIGEIHLLADAENLPSRKTAQAIGFRERGRLYRDGTELIHFIWREKDEKEVDD